MRAYVVLIDADCLAFASNFPCGLEDIEASARSKINHGFTLARIISTQSHSLMNSTYRLQSCYGDRIATREPQVCSLRKVVQFLCIVPKMLRDATVIAGRRTVRERAVVILYTLIDFRIIHGRHFLRFIFQNASVRGRNNVCSCRQVRH